MWWTLIVFFMVAFSVYLAQQGAVGFVAMVCTYEQSGKKKERMAEKDKKKKLELE